MLKIRRSRDRLIFNMGKTVFTLRRGSGFRRTWVVREDRRYLSLTTCNVIYVVYYSHNEHDGVSNHRRLKCLLNSLFRRTSKKTSKLRVTGLCEGNSPVTYEYLTQMASNAENVSIWWRHHGCWLLLCHLEGTLCDHVILIMLSEHLIGTMIYVTVSDAHVINHTCFLPTTAFNWGLCWTYHDHPQMIQSYICIKIQHIS